MRTFAIALAAASGVSLVPLALLTRATRQLVPGRGPQGGEAYSLFWLLFLAWTWFAASAAFVATGFALAQAPLVRNLLWPGASLAGVTLWLAFVSVLLARGADPPAGATRLGAEVTAAGLLAALLLVASQAVLLRAALTRG